MIQTIPNLPEAIETEKLVLAVLLNEPDAASTILALERDDFYLEQHKRILDAARWCYDNGQEITCHTVYQRLTDKRYAESVGGLTYLTGLDVPHIYGLTSYLGTLRIKSTLRRAALAAHELAERCCMPDAEIDDIRAAESFLRDIAARVEYRDGLRGLAQSVNDCGGLDKLLAPSAGESIPTPWKGLNKLLTGGGFLPGQLIVIGARTGLGKSALAAMLARYARKEGVAVFSLEMTTREVWMRMIASAAEVSLKALVEGRIHDVDARREVHRAVTELSESPLWVDDGVTSNVAAIVAAIKQVKGVRLVVIDYLQLLSPLRKRQTRAEEVGEISRALKLAAHELKVPIIVLSQLTRKSSEDDRPPELHDLRESGSIELDANTVMFLHASRKEIREAIENNRPNDLELIIRKQRNGAIGKIKLAFLPATMQIWEQSNET